MKCIFRIAIAAAQVAPGEADEYTGQTRMHGFSLNTVKDFIYLEVHDIDCFIGFNSGHALTDDL